MQTEFPKERPLAAEYVLGLLPSDQAEAFETAMKGDPMLRASYMQWAAHFSNENSEVAPVAPPKEVFQNIDKAIFLNDVKEASVLSRWGGVRLFGGLAICLLALSAWILI